MELIIHGTGTMGSILKECAQNKNITITGFADELSNEKGDVIIDFSHFSRLETLLNYATQNHTPLVIATTGYSKEILSQIEEASKTLVEVIENSTSTELKKVYGREGMEKREKNEIGIHAVRGGTIVGEHSVLYCGNDEIIEIKHTALSKKIFAEGAIQGAKFLLDKKSGLYTMKDIFNR